MFTVIFFRYWIEKGHTEWTILEKSEENIFFIDSLRIFKDGERKDIRANQSWVSVK